MRCLPFLLAALVMPAPLLAEPAQPETALTSRELQGLLPPEIAARVLGALSALAEDEDGVNGIQLVDRALDSVALAFPARPMEMEGLCVRRWLVVEFEPVDPATYRDAGGAKLPMRPVGFFANEFYRVVGPVRPWRYGVTADEKRARRAACAAGSATAHYFFIANSEDLAWAVPAIERALVTVRGEAEAAGWLGKLDAIGTEPCGEAALQRICLRAAFSDDAGRPDVNPHEMSIDDVRHTKGGRLESIGEVRFRKSPPEIL